MLQGIAGSRKGVKDAICQSLREIGILWTASLMYLLFLFFPRIGTLSYVHQSF